MNEFSYQFYIDLIKKIKAHLPLLDFSEVNERSTQFFLLRHDVEFSVEKAYELARIEHELLGIHSSYLFQVRNYSYNPFSFKNARLINRIAEMGHKIGLHVNTSGLNSFDHLQEFIINDLNLLKNGIGVAVDRFSFHRPSFLILKADVKIEGLINTYDKLYFHLYQGEPPEQLTTYYFSDSEHRWKYGTPLDKLTANMQKVQLLTHPYSWSKEGLNNYNNFKELVHLKYYWMMQSMTIVSLARD